MESTRATVIMLPTENKSLFAKCIKSGVFAENEGDLVLSGKHTTTLKSNDVWQYQHLYFTTDDKIKEGDLVTFKVSDSRPYVIAKVKDTLTSYDTITLSFNDNNDLEVYQKACKKL